MLGVKKEDRLRAGLTLTEFMSNHLAPKLTARDPHEWRMAYEAKNMAHTAEMRFTASLFRTESRGTHFREDRPRREDPEWLAWTKLREDGGKMVAVKEPVPKKWWPDLTKKYEDRYPRMFPGE
jgi:succinate dehydrogenase/fumarate reductase flavoprotein subunit